MECNCNERNRCDCAPPRDAFLFERLEPRILLSADPVVGVVAEGLATLGADGAPLAEPAGSLDALSALLSVDNPSAQEVAGALSARASSLEPIDLPALEGLFDTADETLYADSLDEPSTPRQQIVFVDPRTPDYEALIRGLETNANGRTLDVVVLDEHRDGIRQIGETLAGRQGVTAVHVISHGEEGAVQLGNGWLSAQTLEVYAPALQSWRYALGEGADLLFYGCNVAGAPEGEALLEGLRTLTGADIAASEDLTGHSALGGDWDLERRTGDIDTRALLDTRVRASWQGLLETVGDDFSSGNYSGQSGSNDWRHDWEEIGDDGDAARGVVRGAFGALRIGGDEVNLNGVAIQREADLDGATSATLTFDYRRERLDDAGGSVALEVSQDHGSTVALKTYNLDGSDSGFQSESIDISAHIDDHFRLYFAGSGSDVESYFYVDNIQIVYDVASNSAPAATDDTLATGEDTPLIITPTTDLLLNDGDADGDTLAVSGFTQPANGSVVDNGDGTWTYTPAADFNGPDSFTYTVSDGRGGSDTAMVTVTVAPVNDAPVASDDNYTVAEDGRLSVAAGAGGLRDNDTDVEGDTLTVNTVTISDVRHGSLLLNSDGSFIYTPDADFNGTDGFTYAVHDGNGGTAEATVDITVRAEADAPTNVSLSNTSVDGGTDTSAGHTVGTLAATDADAGERVTFAIVGGADAEVFSIADGNQLILRDGVLDADERLSYDVLVRATDSTGLTRDQALKIAIDPAAEPPSKNAGKAEDIQPIVTAFAGKAAQTTESSEGADYSGSEETEPAVVVAETQAEGGVAEMDRKPAPTPPIENPTNPVIVVVPTNDVAAESNVLDLPRPSSDPIQRAVSPEDPLQRALAAFAPAQALIQATDSTAAQFDSPLEAAAFLRELQQVRDTVSEGGRLETAVMGSTFAVTTGLSIGYVIWLLRGGVLLTTVLSALPAWAFIDPMPVLGHSRNAAGDEDAESLESMVSDAGDDGTARRQNETDKNRFWSAP